MFFLPTLKSIFPSGKNFCAGRSSGNYEDPDRCDGYITCSGGITYKRQCPQTLHFNKKAKRCDWPSNIVPQCKKGKEVFSDTVPI